MSFYRKEDQMRSLAIANKKNAIIRVASSTTTRKDIETSAYTELDHFLTENHRQKREAGKMYPVLIKRMVTISLMMSGARWCGSYGFFMRLIQVHIKAPFYHVCRGFVMACGQQKLLSYTNF